jgi:hypothetical protein
VDRRDAPPADAETQRAAIQAAMKGVQDEIGDCVEQWAEVEPAMQGRVTLAFQLDASGLQDAWIEQHSDVPGGPLSCFATALYSADWRGITKEPLEVTYPFVVVTEGDDE